MITTDLKISTPGYWDEIYKGKNDNAKVDASNTVRPPNPFDRFGWVAALAEGPTVLGIASGHAHIEKRIKAAYPDWHVYASDQAPAAVTVANYNPYLTFSAYDIPFQRPKCFDTVICCQAMEYMENQELFLKEACRVGKHLLITVPIGEMDKWSQLRIYSEDNVKELLQPFGDILHFERYGDLLMVKLKFYE